MISVTVSGLRETIDAIRSIPTAVGRETLLAEAAEDFVPVLAEATPRGWSGKLPRSVLAQGGVVGYEAGVETAGNPSLDGKRRRTRWASVEQLETVLQDAIEDYISSFSGSVLAQFAEEVDSVVA